ncbi:MAG: class I SAM-dependent methyltransferase [Calditrichaeota bacterium]|nr:class I SAM-dependent methyltransferase [Calditrichota bacterium]
MNSKRVKQIKKDFLFDPFFGDAVEYILDKRLDVLGSVILESGCGAGKTCLYFALQGAKTIGLDLKKHEMENGVRLAESFELRDKCLFLKGNSAYIPIESNSVDIIFSKSTIQYMDRKKVLNEYMRILKSDGVVILIENLPHNPLINLYRLRRRLISKTLEEEEYVESILGYITPNEVESFTDRFKHSTHREFHLFRMISIYLRLHLKHNRVAMIIDIIIAHIDKRLLSMFPFLRDLAWYTAVYCKGKMLICDRKSANSMTE